MDAEIVAMPLPVLGLCNFCLEVNAVKSMFTENIIDKNKEIYNDMLINCFGIDINKLDLGDTKRVICEVCIVKLRECVVFRKQVETSLKSLEDSVKLNVKKEEDADLDIADFGADDVFSEDDEPILKYVKLKQETEADTPINNITKYEKKPKGRPKKRLIKLKLRKVNDLSETESMLEAGLFPFKIKRNGTFSCGVCTEKSKNLDDIKTHVTNHSKTEIHYGFMKLMFSKSQRFFKSANKIRCAICTTDLTNYDELKNHINNCSQWVLGVKKWNKLPFKLEKDQLDCPVCKKTFINFVNLNTHMNTHYPNHICENCGKAFASKARLRGHMRTHEVGEFACKYCNAVFDRVTKRENHVSKEHKAGVRYACKRCNISLPSFYARQKHLAEVHNEELKRYKCKACPQSYITPGHLSSHVRRDHLNERNHKCDKCDLAFYTKNALKMHMIKHDGERIHSCPVCNKSYQRKKTLREHMRIHDNDKRFICPVCGRAFTQKCTLKGHLKVHERKVDVDSMI